MPKETRKKRRKRKGGTSDLCKLFGDTNGDTREKMEKVSVA